MKKMVLVITLAVIALSSNAFAQSYSNNIGIYLDQAGTNNCAQLAPFAATPAYVVLTQLTAPSVLGWEAKITFSANLSGYGFVNSGMAVDAGSRPGEHVVAFGAPLPAVGGAVMVASLTVLPMDAAAGYAYAGPIYFSMLNNGLPAYLDEFAGGITLHPATGQVTDPIFSVNDPVCLTVPVNQTTFGNVKSLFR